jgi:hypothetical protein
MAESVSSFNEYVEEGSKLSNFQELYASLEEAGKDMKSAKGFVDSVKNLEFLDNIRDKFAAATSVNDKINSGLKKLGLTDKAIALLNNATGGLLSSADPFIMSLYGAAETFASNILEDVISAIMANVYVPEEIFILGVKGLALGGSDPNVRNILRDATLRHDLANTLEWLDKYNGTKYDISSPLAHDAVSASKNGCFNVATYILKQLKVTYNEIKSTVALTERDEDFKANELLKYENYFNEIIRYIFVYSYSNLSVNAFRAVIKHFPTFTPSCLGVNDEVYSKRAKISTGEIDILAPFRRYKTVEAVINPDAPDKVFIVPRNKNIKSIYVWLAFSTDYNTNELLIHQELHDRLKHKMLSTVEEAYYEAQKSLIGSPLARYIQGAKETYLSLLSKYVDEMDPYLFDPRNQSNLRDEDRMVLPDFKPYTPSQDEKNIINKLPELPDPDNKGLNHSDFEVYYVDPSYTNEQITRDSLDIAIRRKLPHMIAKTLERNPLDINDTESVYDTFFIFFNEKFTNKDKDQVLLYLIAKYVIDIYLAKGYTLEMIASLYPQLNESGVLSQFKDYIQALMNKDDLGSAESPYETGPNRPVQDISFHTEVINGDGNLIKIDPTGINIYNARGEKVASFNDVPGTPVGISITGDDIYVLVINPKTGDKEVYYSPDNGLTWGKMNDDGNDAVIYPGIGITSLDQMNFYEVIYYNNTFFKISDNGILFSYDKINWYSMDLHFDEKILGISIAPDGTLYVITEHSVYGIPDFSVDSTNSDIKKIAENNKDYTVIKGIIGTILNAASVPYNTLDDFDIDDKTVIRNLLLHYQSTRLMYYWYSTESPITPEIFQKNIEMLEEKYEKTTDPLLRKDIEKKIAKQTEYMEKLSG